MKKHQKLLLATTLLAGTLAAPLLAAPVTSAQTVTQATVWKNTMSQTSNKYWGVGIAEQQTNLGSTTKFTNGRAYLKITVTAKPSTVPMYPNVCFWRDQGSQGDSNFLKNKWETCAPTQKNGTGTGVYAISKPGTYYFDLGQPNTWWTLPGPAPRGPGWDWSKQASRGRIMLKDARHADHSTRPIFMEKACGKYCYKPLSDLGNHIPVTMNSELIFVANGAKLQCPSDWSSPLCTGGSLPPTPTTPTTTPTTPTTTPTTPTTKPPTPTTPPTGGSLTVNAAATTGGFTATANLTGATQYQFRYKLASTQQWIWDQTRLNTVTVTGLTAGKQYDLQVRAYINKQWQTVWTSTTVTPTANSTPPTQTTAPAPNSLVVTATPATRRFTATANLDGAKYYQFRYKLASTQQWIWDQTRLNTVTVTGLTAGKQYDLQVRAYINKQWQTVWTSTTVTPTS